jgi:hypothetical protein
MECIEEVSCIEEIVWIESLCAWLKIRVEIKLDESRWVKVKFRPGISCFQTFRHDSNGNVSCLG